MTDPISLIHASINAWPQQFKQAANEAQKIRLPAKPSRLVFCGMGGSGIGARVLAGIVRPELKIPFEIVTNYSLPPLDHKSIVIAASYSGNTEETLACASAAYRKKLPLIVMGVDGSLLAWARLKKIPLIRFDPRHNPSVQPRLGFGYTIGALATLLARWHLSQIFLAYRQAGNFKFSIFKPNQKGINTIAKKLIRKAILIFGADHLAEVARLGAYFFNETAKQFAFALPLPEANHHILEAKLPTDKFAALFLDTAYENSQYKKRLALTRKVLGLPSITLTAKGKTRFAQTWDAASQLGHLSAELARANHVDPTKLPGVEGFKKLL